MINSIITVLNKAGSAFCPHALTMLIQSSILIILLLALDLLLRKKVRAIFRYCIWMLVFVKLILPPTLSLPTGIGYWFADSLTVRQVAPIATSDLSAEQSSITTESKALLQPLNTARPEVRILPEITKNTTLIETTLPRIYDVSTTLSSQAIVFLVWLAGVVVLFALLIQRMLFVKGLIAQSEPPSQRLLETLNECRRQIGIRTHVELRLSKSTISPAVCGLFKPTIILPASLLQKLSKEKLRAVLIHELAHIKRADIWVNLLQTVLQVVYFYNPLLWLVNAKIRQVREQAVDETVLVHLGPETQSYSNTLIDIAEMTFSQPNFSLRLIGVVESKKTLERRIKYMLTRPIPKSSKLGIVGLIVIVVIGAILLPMGCNPPEQTALERPVKDGRIADNIIVPGLRVGEYTFDMSKDDVLKSLGKPKAIFYGEERYTLGNLPRMYYMSFDDIFFRIVDDLVKEITVHSPLYKFTNGLGVGDSEQKIKQAFGDNFHLKETEWKDFLTYKDESLEFEIHKNNRTVIEINISKKSHIPSTSTINENGRIVDKIDYPFVNDPEVIGTWKSVDFVGEIKQFEPSKRRWKHGELYFKELSILSNGKTFKPWWTWTKGLIFHSGDKTASKYTIKQIDGSKYMFFEWKSGDYVIRQRKPSYYVLKKVSSDTEGIAETQAFQPKRPVKPKPAKLEKRLPTERLTATKILTKLASLNEQLARVRRELRLAEQGLQDIRAESGFADLEERSYPHPVTQRLIRLENQRDNCVLEVAELKAKLESFAKQPTTPEAKANLKSAQDNLFVAQSKLEALEKMVQEAAARKRDFDQARVRYKRGAHKRDGRRRRLDEIISQIEKLRTMYDDAQRSKVQPGAPKLTTPR